MSTIRLTEELKTVLKEAAIEDESYEQTIRRLLGGTCVNLNNLYEKPAFKLTRQYPQYNFEHLNISWNMLKNSEVGDIFEVDYYLNCGYVRLSDERLKILYVDDKVCIAQYLKSCIKDDTSTVFNFDDNETNDIESKVLAFNFI